MSRTTAGGCSTRFFFRRRIPRFDRVLLVESGSRRISEELAPVLRQSYGDDIGLDLITCYAGLPRNFPETATAFRISDYPGRAGFQRLCAEIAARNYSVLGIICSAEPIMTKWKWALAARLPCKVFVINENADYFWLDWSNWRVIVFFALYRVGLAGPGAVRNLGRLALFPFTLLYLVLYAAAAHLRRSFR